MGFISSLMALGNVFNSFAVCQQPSSTGGQSDCVDVFALCYNNACRQLFRHIIKRIGPKTMHRKMPKLNFMFSEFTILICDVGCLMLNSGHGKQIWYLTRQVICGRTS